MAAAACRALIRPSGTFSHGANATGEGDNHYRLLLFEEWEKVPEGRMRATAQNQTWNFPHAHHIPHHRRCPQLA